MHISFLSLLTVAFVILKLTGHIAWSWFWVLSPLIIPFGIIAFIYLSALLFAIGDAVRKTK